MIGWCGAKVVVSWSLSLFAAFLEVVVDFLEKNLSFLEVKFLFDFGVGFACEDLANAAEAAE